MPPSVDPSDAKLRAALAELRRLAELLPALAEAEDLETIRSRLRHLGERTALAVREIEGEPDGG